MLFAVRHRMGGEMAQGGACASLQVGGGDARRGEDGGASKGNERERERKRERQKGERGCWMRDVHRRRTDIFGE